MSFLGLEKFPIFSPENSAEKIRKFTTLTEGDLLLFLSQKKNFNATIFLRIPNVVIPFGSYGNELQSVLLPT
jgi:hypothetical protein